MNDFDETLPGPWEWDVKRLAASIEVAGRDGGMKPADRRAAVEATVRQYREAMRDFAGLTELGVWYSRLEGEALVALVRAELGPKEAPNLEANLAKARSKDSMKAFSKLTTVVDGQAHHHRRPAAHRPHAGPRQRGAGRPHANTSSTSCSGPTGARCRPTGATCSSSTASWT